MLKNCIVCPYHGWEYRPDGQCVKIPAQPDRAVPKKARVLFDGARLDGVLHGLLEWAS
jgi:phenylpropionate dioxygenase-like ring-hydroxylating dioxygenase large terminal subunit